MTDIQKENKSGGKVPNLRFPEFKEGWEVKKLGEISTNKSKKYNPNNETNFIKCIELEHLSSETGQLLGFVDGSQSGSIKNVFQKGDVLFGKLRPYLKKYYQPNFDGVCSSEIWVLNGKEILNDFLYYLIQTNSFVDLANQSSGSKMPRADWSILENGLFSFPNSEEQQKIASFLSLIEERIQTQNKIIKGLKSLKIALAKKIFLQELRLKDDNGNDFPEWEEDCLENVCDIKKGEQFNKEDLNEIGLYPCLNGGISPSGFSEKYNTDENTITISEGGNSCGFVNIMKTKFWLGGHCYKILLFKKISLMYFYQLLKFNEQNVMNLRVGSGLPNIQMKSLKRFTIKISTSESEQNKIANFLSAIDSKIDIESQLLQKFEEQKKFLLQNMFV